jgi:hypothetical protein
MIEFGFVRRPSCKDEKYFQKFTLDINSYDISSDLGRELLSVLKIGTVLSFTQIFNKYSDYCKDKGGRSNYSYLDSFCLTLIKLIENNLILVEPFKQSKGK